MDHSARPILFFDGVCGLCNFFVNWLFRIDKNEIYLVSPLQSDFARQSLELKADIDFKTLIILHKKQRFEKSDAVFKILSDVGGVYSGLLIFKVLPKFLRDLLYDFVAQNRYTVFGKSDVCRLPTEAERSRFLLNE